MQTIYNLEGLIKKFSEHAKFADDYRENQLNEYKKEFPEQDVPEHLLQDFNLARALSYLASEIDALKKHCC